MSIILGLIFVFIYNMPLDMTCNHSSIIFNASNLGQSELLAHCILCKGLATCLLIFKWRRQLFLCPRVMSSLFLK